jgi:ribosomal protein S18 acetylase RimI-like enzyme
MRIRLAEPRDAAPIASVHVRAWQTAYRGIIDDIYLQELSVADRETGWNKRLADNAILTLLAEEDGNTVGFITGGKSRDAGDPPSTAEIYSIYIDPLYSRKGIGSALLQQMVKRLRRLGFKEMMLWVLCQNASARAFYERQMMQSEDGKTRKITIGGQAHTEIRYRLRMARG